MILIYMITNMINNKKYIGQTKHSLKWRFYNHCQKSNGCKKLCHAIQKYGKENFIITKIDEAPTREEANIKERYYISYYNTQIEGYNIAEGGFNAKSTRRKRVICLETGEKFDSITDCAKKYNANKVDYIARVCHGNKPTFKGYHFAFLDKDDKPRLDKIRLNAPKSHKKTLCIETGEIFKDSKSASDWLGVHRNAVSMCCRGLCKTIKGYHFKYVEE